jgi:hypothetical protein
MTTLLPSLTATAPIRRVKPADPENRRRSPERQQHRGQKRKQTRQPSSRGDAPRASDQQPDPARSHINSKGPQPETDKQTNTESVDKTIDIRV